MRERDEEEGVFMLVRRECESELMVPMRTYSNI